MNVCDHFANDRAGQTLDWTSTDNEENFRENCRCQKKRSLLEQHGWLTPKAVIYRHNSHGFRCDEFDNRSGGVALGASVTFGVGVPEHQTWHQILSKNLKKHIWNLGVEGASLDTCYRVLFHYIKLLNVEFVVLAVPPTGRFELMAHHGRYQIFGMHMEPDRHKEYVKEWLLDDRNADINAEKNIRAMRDLCHEHGIGFFSTGYTTYFPDDIGLARDLRHPGTQAHADFAVIIEQGLTREINYAN